MLSPGTENAAQFVNGLQHSLAGSEDTSDRITRSALIVGPGAMRGIFSAGVVNAFQDLEMGNRFDVVIGISAGTASCGYMLSGQAKLGMSIYFDDLTTGEFINPMRFGNALNLSLLEDVLRNQKELDQQAIKGGASEFYIGMTEALTARQRYVEVAQAQDKDIVSHIIASSSVPGVTSPVIIDGIPYSDGVTACRNPIRFAAEELGCSDIVYVTNHGLRGNLGLSLPGRLLARIATRDFDRTFTKAHINRHNISDEVGANTYSSALRIGVIAPQVKPIPLYCTDIPRLKQYAVHGYDQTMRLFEPKQ